MKYKSILIYGILLLVFIIAIMPWLRQGIPVTDDFRHHATRFWIMSEEIKNLHFSEWNMNMYGGWPIFHFYHPIFYILTIPITALFTPIAALKVSVGFIYLICLIGTFIAGKLLFQEDDIACLIAISYFLSSHFLFNATVSGALPRLMALALVPITTAVFIKVLDDKKYFIPSCLLVTLLLMTHTSVTIPTFVICFIYLIYQSYLDKKIYTRGLIVFGVAILLSSAWTLPMIMEKSYGNFPDSSNISIATPLLKQSFRTFGIKNDGQYDIRSNFFGYSIMILALLGLFFVRGSKTVTLLKIGLISSIFFYFNIFNLLSMIPLMKTAITNSSGYFIGILVINAVMLASICTKKIKSWLVYILIVIIIIELYPGISAFSYKWIDQPTENFVNPPEMIDALKWISYQPGQFGVFTPTALSAEIYHHKQEFGDDWVGCPQCVQKITYDTHNQIYQNFINGYKNDEQFGYLGVKYYVLPCQITLNNTLIYTNEKICIYQNDKFTSLIETNAIVTNEKWESDKVSFTTISNKETTLVIKINYFKPHWRAYINGKETQITTVIPEYMGIMIPSGTNEISFEYRTNLLHIISWIITLLTFIGIFFNERFIKRFVY